ncbi:hypothetical protein [Flaviaesturariibacter amylovorans]|uniref:Uncharacterized protein n=1 Tax=Flaviaesturariibacter amylovorans TaxID=1084520 RepID=A0ABP8GPW8_9BACT
MTYREAVQIQIAVIEALYDNAGGLRDAALSSEKNTWNQMRTGLRDLSSALRKMDDAMPDEHAAFKLRGDYNIDSTKI